MTRLMDRKVLIFVAALAVAALLVWSWQDDNSLLPSAGQEAESAHNPDAFVTNGHYRTFRGDGQLSSLLTSPRAVHYPHDNSGHLQSPQIQLFPEDGQPWHAESEEGLLDFNSDLATLRKNVRLQSLGDSPHASTLETEELILNNRTRFITTDQPVKITSLQGEVTAIGMDAYVDEERMILKSHVKGLYAPASP